MNDIEREVLKEIPHENYIEKIERWKHTTDPDTAPVHMHNGYSKDGHYIGDIETARTLCDKLGIVPELRDTENTVCSVGFCPKENKYAGWSHRALVKFGIGDKLFEEDFGDDNTPFIEHGSQTINTLEEARESACRFAKSVAKTIGDVL